MDGVNITIKPCDTAERVDGVRQGTGVRRFARVQEIETAEIVLRRAAGQGVVFAMVVDRDGDVRVTRWRVPQLDAGLGRESDNRRGLTLSLALSGVGP